MKTRYMCRREEKMKVLVEFCLDMDIIECPDWIVEELPTYQIRFQEWLFNKENNHSYWMYKNGEKNGCRYRSKAFVEWLNEFVLHDYEEKASVIEECVKETGYICRAIYPEDIQDILADKKWDFAEWLQLEDEKGSSREENYIKAYSKRAYFEYAAVDWVNEFILNTREEKAYVIEKQVDFNEMKDMPKIHF